MVINNGLGMLTFEKPSWPNQLRRYRIIHVQPLARKLIVTCLDAYFCGVDIRDGKTAKHNVWNPKYPIYSPYVYLDLRLSIH